MSSTRRLKVAASMPVLGASGAAFGTADADEGVATALGRGALSAAGGGLGIGSLQATRASARARKASLGQVMPRTMSLIEPPFRRSLADRLGLAMSQLKWITVGLAAVAAVEAC